MTELPPPLPLEHSLIERSATIRQWIAWIVILLCVSLFVWESQAVSRWSTKEGTSETPAAPPFQLTLQGRYLFGLQQNFQTLGTGLQPAQASDSIVAIDKGLKSPGDRLRIVPLIAELQGEKSAQQRLKEIRPLLSTPFEQDDAEVLDKIYSSIGAAEVGQPEHDTLVAHQGWLGELALTWKHPADAPDRQAVIKAATRTLIAAGLFVLLVIGSFIVGLVLFIIAIVRFSGGTLRPRYVPPARVFPRFLEAFALYLVGMIVLSLIARSLHATGLWPSFFIPLLPPLALAWPAWRYGARSTARSVGWMGGFALFREMVSGVAGYLAGLPVMALGIGLSLLLGRLVDAQPTHPVVQFASGNPSVILQLFLLASVVAPLVEETMFRGALYHALRGRFGWLISAVVVGIIFAAIHPQGWTTIPALGAIGFVLATIREWRNSLIASMTAHALNNAVVCTFLVFAMGNG